jgi:hypothetical protein
VKPIQHCGESNETEESLGEFLVAGADASHALDAHKEGLDDVPVSIEQLGIAILDSTGPARGDAWLGIDRDQFLARRPSVTTSVANDSGKLIEQPCGGAQIMAVAGRQTHPRGTSQPIDDHSDLGVGSAFGFANGLSGRANCGVSRHPGEL